MCVLCAAEIASGREEMYEAVEPEMPAATKVDEDASSSSDEGFEVKAVTTADGVRHAKFVSPVSRPASSLRALTVYEASPSSSTSSSSDDGQIKPVPKTRIKKRVRFAQPESSNKRARNVSPESQRSEGESADEEAALMSELAQFEARVEDIDRDPDAVTIDLLDANDFHEQLAQQRLERRVALLRRRLHNKNVVNGMRDNTVVNMDTDEVQKEDLSDDNITIRGVLKPP